MWNDAGSALDVSFFYQIRGLLRNHPSWSEAWGEKNRKSGLQNPEKMHLCSFVQEGYFVNDHTVRTEVEE